MSWSDRRGAILLLAGGGLAACGFDPVLAPGAPAGRLQGRIGTAPPDDPLGLRFVARIEERLGRAPGAPFVLGYRLRVDSAEVGITRQDVSTRVRLDGRVDWRLDGRVDGQPAGQLPPDGAADPLLSGEAEGFTAYTTSSTTVATLFARRDAEDRLMILLADRVVTVLYARAGDLP